MLETFSSFVIFYNIFKISKDVVKCFQSRLSQYFGINCLWLILDHMLGLVTGGKFVGEFLVFGTE